MSGLFVPGWGAAAGLYRAAMPPGWEVLEPPGYRTTHGELDAYRRWLRAEVERRGAPVRLAGHSMGGALSVLAALDLPELVERLVLVSPAGFPLVKPIRASALTAAGQALRGCYPPGALVRMAARAVASPRAALRLARTVHRLDLTPTLGELRARGLPCTVVACAGDRLTTAAHCRRLAEALGADYREVDAADGHIWVITQPDRLARELERAAPHGA